jgi:cytidylate kinase
MAWSIEEQVDRQIRKWLEQQRRSEQEPRVGEQQPMICISREFGAQGLEIARIVAGRLDFDLYERDLVEEIAHSARLRQRAFESLNAATRSELNRRIEEQFTRGAFATSDYLRTLSQILLTLGRHGHGIVVGRGAQFVLDPGATLRVRVYAPMDIRVARVAASLDLPPQEARARVLHEDAERAAFCWRNFGRDVRDPASYDLLLSSGSLSLAACSSLVIDAFQAKLGGGAA